MGVVYRRFRGRLNDTTTQRNMSPTQSIQMTQFLLCISLFFCNIVYCFLWALVACTKTLLFTKRQRIGTIQFTLYPGRMFPWDNFLLSRKRYRQQKPIRCLKKIPLLHLHFIRMIHIKLGRKCSRPSSSGRPPQANANIAQYVKVEYAPRIFLVAYLRQLESPAAFRIIVLIVFIQHILVVASRPYKLSTYDNNRI